MDSKKRSILYLLRKRNRSVILLLILFVVTTLMLSCIVIGNAADSAMERLFQTMGGYFKIETDNGQGTNAFVNDEFVEDVMNSYEIQAFNGMDTVYFMTKDLGLQPGRFTLENDEKAGLVRVLGNTDSSLSEYFILQSLVLTQGSHISGQDINKALISEELAENNGLAIGDTISMSYYGEDSKSNWYSFEIAGIFQVKSHQNTYDSNTAECDMVENFIFVNTQSVRDMVEEVLEREINTYKSGALFFTDTPQKLEKIVDELEETPEHLMDGYRVTKNNKLYQESKTPLERLKNLTGLIIMIIITLGFIILSLTLMLWTRERVHEIGIYLSMGISKISILTQHMIENLLLAVLAFLISCILVAALIPRMEQVVFAVMDEEDSSQVHEAESSAVQNGDTIEVEMEIEMNVLSVLEIGLLEVCVVVLATGISSFVILKMKPKSILSIMS